MTFKKWMLLGLSLVSVTALTACVVPSKKEETSAPVEETTTTEVEKTVTEEERAAKDAEIILTGLFTGKASGFKNVMGESITEWRDRNIEEYVEENDEQFDILDDPEYYEDPSDTEYTIYYNNDKFTTDKVLEVFQNTRLDIVASIGDDFTIDNVEIDDDVATVTFSSRGIALLDLANQVGNVKSMLLGSIENSLELGKSQDETVKSYNALMNYFLYYLIFDRERVYLESEVNFTTKREFTLILEKQDKHWVLTDDNYNELFASIMVDEYSDTQNDDGTEGA